MARRRPLSRRKKTAAFVAVTGIASGIAVVILWPYIQRLRQTPSITAGTPTVTPSLAALLR
jgi:hypothetical protein